MIPGAEKGPLRSSDSETEPLVILRERSESKDPAPSRPRKLTSSGTPEHGLTLVPFAPEFTDRVDPLRCRRARCAGRRFRRTIGNVPVRAGRSTVTARRSPESFARFMESAGSAARRSGSFGETLGRTAVTLRIPAPTPGFVAVRVRSPRDTEKSLRISEMAHVLGHLAVTIGRANHGVCVRGSRLTHTKTLILKLR